MHRTNTQRKYQPPSAGLTASRTRNPLFVRALSPDTAPIPGNQQPDYLARWLAETPDPNSYAARLWHLFQTPRFADLWYSAREAGEHLRATALAALSTNRPHPGGSHPDPREPAAFSNSAVLSEAARILGLKVWLAPEHIASVADANAPLHLTHHSLTHHSLTHHSAPQRAWLLTYPDSQPPDIATRNTSDLAKQQFAIACVIGFACRERARLLDPDAPAGIILLPHDPAIVTVLHQFAIGLLGLPRDCPEDSVCACNIIRARFNAPPPGHEQPTDALSLQDLRALVKRQSRAAPPHGEKMESGPLT